MKYIVKKSLLDLMADTKKNTGLFKKSNINRRRQFFGRKVQDRKSHHWGVTLDYPLWTPEIFIGHRCAHVHCFRAVCRDFELYLVSMFRHHRLYLSVKT